MSSLYNDFESIVPKLAGLSAGVFIEKELNLQNMIAGPADGEIVKSLKMAGMLRVAEFVGDYVVSISMGTTPPNLGEVLSISTAEEVAAIGAALYVIEKLGLEDQIRSFTGDSKVLQSVALSVTYLVAQESVNKIMSMY